MNRDKILAMAREAGFEQQMRHRDGSVTVLPDALFVRFYELARAEALEEAAKACEAAAEAYEVFLEPQKARVCETCAADIRALKEQQ